MHSAGDSKNGSQEHHVIAIQERQGIIMYPLITVEGSHFEMGLQHGALCAERIRTLFNHTMDLFLLRQKTGKDEVLSRCSGYLPTLEKHCPHLVEEVKGIAAGAGFSLPEVLFLHMRTELAHRNKSGCSAFAVSPDVSKNGILLSGQNWDNLPYFKDKMIVLRLRPKNKPEVMQVTFPGVIGYIGINSRGVSIWDNQLMCPGWKVGVPHYFLKRMVLEQDSMEGAVELLFKSEKASSENFVITDGSGKICSVECTPHDIEILAAGNGAICHTNHFLSNKFLSQERYVAELPDTCSRLVRFRELLEKFHARLSSETMKTILSDHENFPNSLCRHVDHSSQSMITCSSVIAEPARGLLYVAPGNPCVTQYFKYDLHE